MKRLILVLLIATLSPTAVRSAAPGANEAALLANLKWRSIGPANMGGRVTAIEGVAGDPYTFYVGGADGGIFKTTNGGSTFKPIFDNQAVLSIGALTVAPSDPNVLWVGTGEGDPRNTASFADPTYLYNAKFVQAAPGKLIALIDHYKARMTSYASTGDEPPLWIRHSQGDKWDLMLLFPMGSYGEYYRPERAAKREIAERNFREKSKELVSWQEDLFVYGPPVGDLRGAFSKGAFFHLEIFHSLPGRHADLYKEREMENAYQRTLGRPENFIFVRDQGASWDLFTLGVYRDLKHYAESVDISPAAQDAAAKKAGFERSNRIGLYLRELIADHHDTLAVAVK